MCKLNINHFYVAFKAQMKRGVFFFISQIEIDLFIRFYLYVFHSNLMCASSTSFTQFRNKRLPVVKVYRPTILLLFIDPKKSNYSETQLDASACHIDCQFFFCKLKFGHSFHILITHLCMSEQ